MCFKIHLNQQYKGVLIALLILLSFVPSNSVSAQDTTNVTPPSSEILSVLTRIAAESLYAQLDALTNTANASNSHELAVYYQAATQEKITEAATRHTALTTAGILYGNYTLQFSTTDVQVDGNSAILSGSEYTIIELDNAKTDPLAPQTTEYVDEHTFRFQYVDGAWYLIEDQVQMPLNAEADPLLPPITDQPSSTESNSNLRFSIYLPVVVATSDTQVVQASGEQQVLLDLSSIASYARKWWNSANPDYRNWLPDADCTNFASQALKAGGWAYTTRWPSSKYWTSAWWYASDDQTRTWTAADWFYSFAPNRATLAANVRDLRVGDVLQIDWEGDGPVDHTAIVTKKDSSNNLYLTYHSNNRLDKPLADIKLSYPKAKYYAWKLN